MANKTNKKITLSDITQSGASNGQIPTYNSISGQYEATTPVSGSTVTADNGLTNIGSNVQLGGQLIQATDITYGVNTLTQTINSTGQHKILASGSNTGSASTGGAINLTQVGDGSGMVLYTARNAATAGNLLHLNVNGAAYNKQALRVDYIGSSHASTIYNKNTSTINSVALNLVSDNVQDSTLFVSGKENNRGTIKAAHNNASGTAAGDASAAAISIDLQDNDTLPYATSATATATVTAGVVTTITIVNGSTGYGVAPIVTITGGGGTGATATAVITGGVVTAVNIINGGTGYTTAPTVTITLNTGTSAKGIFMTSTAVGGTNGNLVELRNNKGHQNSTLSLFKIDSEGRAIFTPSLANTQALQVGLQSQTFLAYSVLTSGTMQWGSGSAVFDSRMYRVATNVMKIEWTGTQSTIDNTGRLSIGTGANTNSCINLDGAISRKTVSTGVSRVLNALDDIVFVTANVPITLPLSSTCIGRQYTVFSDYAGGFTIACTGADVINGLATYTAIVAANQKATIVSTGASWKVIGN
jgi:hypothetical protein